MPWSRRSSESTVTVVAITIGAPTSNNVPVADARSVTTEKNAPLGLALTAGGFDGDARAFTIVSGPLHGTLSGSGANLTYTPDANYTGSDSFDFGIDDNHGGSDSATVSTNFKMGGAVRVAAAMAGEAAAAASRPRANPDRGTAQD